MSNVASACTGGTPDQEVALRTRRRRRKTFLDRHRGTVGIVAGALTVVGVAGAAQIASHSAHQLDSAQPNPDLGSHPYGIGLGQDSDLLDMPPSGTNPHRRGAPGTYGASSQLDRGTRLENAPGVTLIDTRQSQGEGMGTGMVLTSEGQVVTNYHVVEGSETVQVTIPDTDKTYTASIIGRDKVRDVALLQLKNAHGLKTVSVSEAAVRLGDSVHAVGNGNGQGYLTRLDGKVTGINQAIDVSDEVFGSTSRLNNLIRTDADVVPGYSGGPLLDSTGRVIGLTTAASAGIRSSQVDGYATPMSEVMNIIRQIRAGNESGDIRLGRKAALGVSVGRDPHGREGASVVEITPNSPAAKIGIKIGDLITEIDDEEIESAEELATAVGSLDPGETVQIAWVTDHGIEHDTEVTLTGSTLN
ncbi:S1C family serine protease [Dermatophilus congolensis]|uniref:Putative serine protease HtrA n=1 Tax=Dermatophilus congolensis TaxID=1863 RepID=A0A239VPK2_9MICO|nr:trypsin-like peptidase domain-containing protein [Dermatophilus congolensis]MBO3129711.1 PDZ domain-containing protein [Dermatophilus congolensis]MBO3131659.1 PDZ domain-containing protein [Dermatophilus congolensis]MBO3134185.1 PDZ domain-containing protein [Dermatophilus congolensis]MBO3136419.1 PDZ domain-containing protein [Dermatophilus congolensis]MBO3138667.1 PDZ domain-containing protein [Dermatophilus congolensis]